MDSRLVSLTWRDVKSTCFLSLDLTGSMKDVEVIQHDSFPYNHISSLKLFVNKTPLGRKSGGG